MDDIFPRFDEIIAALLALDARHDTDAAIRKWDLLAWSRSSRRLSSL